MNLAEKVFYPKFLRKCRIDKEIPESVFLKNERIRDLDQSLFQLYFLNACLRFIFRPDQGDLPNIENVKNDRNEIHILEIEIKTRSDGWHRMYKFAKSVFEGYAYPLLLILRYKDEFCIFTAITHENSRKTDRYVSDSIQGSGWFSADIINHYSPPEDYYFMPEQNFTVRRNTLDLIPKVMTEGSNIKAILESWYQIVREDRAQWVYFYHMTDGYRTAESVIGTIISKSKMIEKIFDDGYISSDESSSSMEEDFWPEEDE